MTHVSENLAGRLRQVLAAHLADPRRSRYCIAFSGGLDSSVLLALMTSIIAEWPDAALRAIHVNHGLYADADRWQSAAQAVAQKLAVDFSAIRITVAEDAPGGLEATARDARYRALADAMADGEVLVCAHHLDDQLETFLLQLMRGAGLAGLAAMPVVRDLGPGLLLRPLLSVSRDELCDWARQNAVDWCEDSSNQDQQFARNYLRHRILPLLRERWPTVAGSVARSAAHCAEAESVLAELAKQQAEKAEKKFKAATGKTGLQSEWRVEEGDTAEIISQQARYHDLAVVGQGHPDSYIFVAHREMPDCMILSCGRPVLVIPYVGDYETIGENV
ncbi:MAG: tRNA lysidine(34) synthetase TilS, partial [Proteobacteria bacterium]|nr:tRNA lysidine(34) synthetase TilS [Pseudomonadota bacterium]